MDKAHLTRQFDLIPMSLLETPVSIIGAGAIGSFTCLQLAKMGFENITVYDFDVVSVENMNCQFFRFKDIGKPKVLALQELVSDFTNIKIKANDEKFKSFKSSPRGIVISAVDSMKVRKDIWDDVKERALGLRWVVDPRMGAMDAALYTVCPTDYSHFESYEATLVDDGDAVQEKCTAKSTIFTANLLSGLVAKIVVECARGNPTRSVQWSIDKNDLIAFGGKDEPVR